MQPILACCSSGVTVNATSNESLRIMPALMYKCASSAISTLWLTDDQDAALSAYEFNSDFTDHHRDDKDLQIDEAASPDAQSQTRIISLALATQRAVLRILHSEIHVGP